MHRLTKIFLLEWHIYAALAEMCWAYEYLAKCDQAYYKFPTSFYSATRSHSDKVESHTEKSDIQSDAHTHSKRNEHYLTQDTTDQQQLVSRLLKLTKTKIKLKLALKFFFYKIKNIYFLQN